VKVTLEKKMASNKDFTLTIIKLVSSEGKEIELENSAVDFKAPDFTPMPELNAAPEEHKSVENMATARKELPPTGTKENIIIILSMLLAGGVLYRKNRTKIS
jgi:hypothetical protein